jgi:hypothetical protein
MHHADSFWRAVHVLVQRPVGQSYTGSDSQLDAAVAGLFQRVGNTAAE